MNEGERYYWVVSKLSSKSLDLAQRTKKCVSPHKVVSRITV